MYIQNNVAFPPVRGTKHAKIDRNNVRVVQELYKKRLNGSEGLQSSVRSDQSISTIGFSLAKEELYAFQKLNFQQDFRSYYLVYHASKNKVNNRTIAISMVANNMMITV